MIKKNKKIIYITSFIVLGIFLVAIFSGTKVLSQNSTEIVRKSTIATASPTIKLSQDIVYTETEAEKFFNTFIERENKFDPEIINLYAEDAIMKTSRLYPDGTVKEMQLTKDQLKQLMPTALALGRQRNDVNTYTDIKYIINDESIKVTAKRFNHYKKYTSDFYMIIIYVGKELQIKEVFYETIP